MRPAMRSFGLRYGCAVVSVALAGWLRFLLDPILGHDFPFILFLVAILGAAWVGGLGPALVAAALSGLVADFFFLPPRGSLAVAGRDQQIGFGLYLLVSLGISLLGGAMRTAQHRAEARARVIHAEREKLRVTLASIGDAVLVTDREGRVVSLNGVAQELTGWTTEQAQGRPLEEVFVIANETTGQPVEHPVARVLRERRVVGLANHTVLIARDGTRRPIDDSAAPIEAADGSTLGVVLIFRDVTESRRAERALRQSEEFNRRIIESSRDCIKVLDLEGRLLSISKGGQCQLEIEDATSLLGRSWIDFWQGAEREAAQRAVATAAAGGVRAFQGFFPTASGKPKWWDVVLSPILDAAGRPERILATSRDITEWRQVQEERQKLIWLVENSPDFIGVADLTQRVLFVNRAGQRLVGLDGDEAVRNTAVLDYFPVGERDRVEQEILPLLRAQGRWDGEVCFRHFTSGQRIPVSWNAFTIPDPNSQQPAFFACVSRDLRERKRAEGLRRTITDNATAALFMLDAEGRCTFMNPAAEQITGYTLAEVQGKVMHDLIHGTHPDGSPYPVDACPIVQALRARLPLRGHEDLFVRRDGTYFPVLCAANPITEGEQLVGTVLEVRDITEEKRNAEILAGQKRALELIVSGTPLAEVLEALCDMVEGQSKTGGFATVLLLDEEGRYLRPAAGRKSPEAWTRAIDPLRIGPCVGSCGTAAYRGEPVIVADISTDPLWADFCGMALSHGLRACWSTPIFSSQRKVLGTFAVYYDTPRRPSPHDVRLVEILTRTASLAIEHKRAEEALREADRRKDEFLATLAHELRNPLAPIRNALQIMRLAGNDTAAVEQAREMMERQMHQMVRLVDDLLDVSRITRGKLELRKQRVELASVLRSAIETSRPLLERFGHELTVTLPDQPVYVDADTTRLAQVFANLLNNAAKYTECGGRVWLTSERQGSDAVITVRDTGIGIPPEMLSRVFEMFTQVDRTLERSQGGLGIGLTLVRRLVDMHGGSVEARSEGHGRGSTFIVRLPLLLDVGGDQPAAPTDEAAAARARHRILVVDDNRDAAISLGIMLQLAGNEIRTAHDGAEGVRLAEEFRPDVVLLDIGLPKLNGYEAARCIRQQPWGRDVVLIAVTGWGQEDDRRRSREAGFNFHMVKPVEPAALEKLLGGLLTTPTDGEAVCSRD